MRFRLRMPDYCLPCHRLKQALVWIVVLLWTSKWFEKKRANREAKSVGLTIVAMPADCLTKRQVKSGAFGITEDSATLRQRLKSRQRTGYALR